VDAGICKHATAQDIATDKALNCLSGERRLGGKNVFHREHIGEVEVDVELPAKHRLDCCRRVDSCHTDRLQPKESGCLRGDYGGCRSCVDQGGYRRWCGYLRPERNRVLAGWADECLNDWP